MLEHWLNDPGKVGATGLLLAAIGALYFGKVVPRWTYDAAILALKEQLKRALDDCSTQKNLNIRLLEQMERRDANMEIIAQSAIKGKTP